MRSFEPFCGWTFNLYMLPGFNTDMCFICLNLYYICTHMCLWEHLSRATFNASTLMCTRSFLLTSEPVSAWGCWSEGRRFKHQYFQAATTGPLSKALKRSPLYKYCIIVDTVFWPHLPNKVRIYNNKKHFPVL